MSPQSALEFCPSHCPNGRLVQDLGFGGFAFALKLPELLNTNLAAVKAKLGQTSCFPNGPQIWCPIGRPVASGGKWGLSPHRYSEPPHQPSAPSPDISLLTSHQCLRIKCGPPPLRLLGCVAYTAAPTEQL